MNILPDATGPVFRVVVEGALANEGHLLVADERAVVEAFLALDPVALHLCARLLHRTGACFRPDRLSAEDQAVLPVLQAGGFVGDGPAALELLTVPELRALCLASGLDARGRHGELLQRALAAGLPNPVPSMLIRHRELFRRMELLWFQDPRKDHRSRILELLGHRRPPSYAICSGGSTFVDRQELLDFEEAWRRFMEDRPGDHLEWAMARLADEPASTLRRRLSPRRIAVRILHGAARDLERRGCHPEAVAIYLALLSSETTPPEKVPLRAVLALNASGHPVEAVALARRERDRADPASALPLERTGHRLARRHRLPWEPLPPLHSPRIRVLDLKGTSNPGQRRPQYAVGEGSGAVEEAVADLLRSRGRRVIQGESAPWTTLFALLTYDLYWMSIPGALPVAGLSGPLDLGHPDFALHREAALAQRLREIQAGQGPERIASCWKAHHGEDVHGAWWDAFTEGDLIALAEALGGPALAAILEILASKGWKARRGLPDLVVLPGPALRLDGAIPGHFPPCLVLAEVKGPGDSLRDEQAAWFQRLRDLEISAEIIQVRRRASER